ncbi:MAG: hypothetical protein ACI837_001256 [Crocinitomicaceae bacterium]|jgi:hypothetical protein
MKHLLRLAIFLFVLNSNFSRSQDLTAISETGTWVIYHNWPEYGWNAETNSYQWYAQDDWTLYKSGGDTTINLNTYKKLTAWPLYRDAGGNFTAGGGYHKLAYRNDNDRRAYRILYGGNSEELWYDFNLQLGDTVFAANQPTAFEPYDQIIIEVDSVDLCDSTYQSFQMVRSLLATPHPDHKAVQRVGTLANLIKDNWNTSEYYKLSFFCESPTGMSYLLNLLDVEEEEEKLPSISVYPNPSSEFIHLSGIDATITEIHLMDAAGRTLSNIDTSSDQIDIHQLSKGLYYLLISNESGVQSVPFVKE